MNEIKRSDARSIDHYVQFLEQNARRRDTSETGDAEKEGVSSAPKAAGRFASAYRAAGDHGAREPAVTTNLLSLSEAFKADASRPSIWATKIAWSDPAEDPDPLVNRGDEGWRQMIEQGRECPECGSDMDAVFDGASSWHWNCEGCGKAIDGGEAEDRHLGRFDHLFEHDPIDYTDHSARYAAKSPRRFKS